MRIFSRIFKQSESGVLPEVQFGRMRSTRMQDKYQSWTAAIHNFENERYHRAYIHLLDYLSDEGEGNIEYNSGKGTIKFRLYQGSVQVVGSVDAHFFSARVKLAKLERINESLMLWLLQENYYLKYSRFSIDRDHHVCLAFDSGVEDGTPYKIYEALKELATKADIKDDVLLSKYPELTLVTPIRARIPSKKEIAAKFDFMKVSLRNLLREVAQGKLDKTHFPGGISFILLDTLFKIDFLVKPEGTLMESISKAYDVFFNNSALYITDKNQEIIQIVEKMAAIDEEAFASQIYDVKKTFSQSHFDGQVYFRDLVRIQMKDFEWYYMHGYEVCACAICGYIVGYALYTMVLPELTKSLLLLYYRIMEDDYFIALGYTGSAFRQGMQLNASTINKEIKRIFKNYSPPELHIKPDLNDVVFDDKAVFGKTFVEMIARIAYD